MQSDKPSQNTLQYIIYIYIYDQYIYNFRYKIIITSDYEFLSWGIFFQSMHGQESTAMAKKKRSKF